jgi:hypothetical protein
MCFPLIRLNYPSTTRKTPLDPDLFAMEMAEASHACIGICKKYDNVNDLVIWLHYEYVVLASTTLGERSNI